jgi:hypothetical protein
LARVAQSAAPVESQGMLPGSAGEKRTMPQDSNALDWRRPARRAGPTLPICNDAARGQYSGLGMGGSVSYRCRVMAFLRFIGLLNAAVWFGTAIFFSFGAGLVPFSQEMKDLLGPANYPYFSGAIAQILIKRYFAFQVGCALVAVLHLLAEWLYLGKYPQKLQVGLIVGLAATALVGAYWLQPKLKVLHATKYGVTTRPEMREAADRSFRAWHGVSQVINLLLVGGLGAYLWRAGNPSDQTRFVSAFRFTMR